MNIRLIKLPALKKIKFPVKISILSKEYTQLVSKPQGLQEKLLKKILQENKNTAYGKKYCFSQIKTIEEYQKKVPLINYEDIRLDIEKIHQGKQNIFTKKDVVFLGTTSGSSGAPKMIPITMNRKKYFQKEIALWSYFSVKELPHLWMGKTLYLIG
jgi:phenylacetate-coenzyme A ligase PaaK-like adenylate-forming protein